MGYLEDWLDALGQKPPSDNAPPNPGQGNDNADWAAWNRAAQGDWRWRAKDALDEWQAQQREATPVIRETPQVNWNAWNSVRQQNEQRDASPRPTANWSDYLSNYLQTQIAQGKEVDAQSALFAAQPTLRPLTSVLTGETQPTETQPNEWGVSYPVTAQAAPGGIDLLQTMGDVLGATGGAIDRNPMLSPLKQGAEQATGKVIEGLRQVQFMPRVIGGAMVASDPEQVAQMTGVTVERAREALAAAQEHTDLQQQLVNATDLAPEDVQRMQQRMKELEPKLLPVNNPAELFGERALATWEQKAPAPVQVAMAFLDPANDLLGASFKAVSWAKNTQRLSQVKTAFAAANLGEDAARVERTVKSMGQHTEQAARYLQAESDLAVPLAAKSDDIINAAKQRSAVYANANQTRNDQLWGWLKGERFNPLKASGAQIVEKIKSLNPLELTPAAKASQMVDRAATVVNYLAARSDGSAETFARYLGAMADDTTRAALAPQVGNIVNSRGGVELNALLKGSQPQDLRNVAAAFLTGGDGAANLFKQLDARAAFLFPAPALDPAQRIVGALKNKMGTLFFGVNPAYPAMNLYNNLIDLATKGHTNPFEYFKNQDEWIGKVFREGQLPPRAAQGIGGAETAVNAVQPGARGGIASTILPQELAGKSLAKRLTSFGTDWAQQIESRASTAAFKQGYEEMFHAIWRENVGIQLSPELRAALTPAEQNTLTRILERNYHYDDIVKEIEATFGGADIFATKPRLPHQDPNLGPLRDLDPDVARQVENVLETKTGSVGQIQAGINKIKGEVRARVQNALNKEPRAMKKEMDAAYESRLRPKELYQGLQTEQPLEAGARPYAQSEIDKLVDVASGKDVAPIVETKPPETARGWLQSQAEQPITPEMQAIAKQASAPEMRGSLKGPNVPLIKSPVASRQSPVKPLAPKATGTTAREELIRINAEGGKLQLRTVKNGRNDLLLVGTDAHGRRYALQGTDQQIAEKLRASNPPKATPKPTPTQRTAGAGLGPGTWTPDEVPPQRYSRALDEKSKQLFAELDRVMEYVKGNFSTKPSPIQPNKRAAIEAWLQNSGVQDNLLSVRAAAEKSGLANRDFVLHDYIGGRLNGDTLLARAFPYHYWATREGATWAQYLLSNPRFIVAYGEYKKQMNEATAGLPPQYKDTARIPFTELRINPELGINPLMRYATFVDQLQDPSKTNVEKGLGAFGVLSPIPGAEAAVRGALGEESLSQTSGRLGQFAPVSRAVRGTTAALRERGVGTNVIPPGGADIEAPIYAAINNALGTNLSSRDTYEPTYVGRQLVDMLTKGEITQAEYDNAIYQQQGPTWDKALNRINTTMGATNVIGFATGLRPRLPLESEKLIEQAKAQMINTINTIKETDPSSAEESQIWQQFREQYPWYFQWADRYGSPEERAQAQQTSQRFAESQQIYDQTAQEIAKVNAKTPLGAYGDVSKLYDQRQAALDELARGTPLAKIASTPGSKSPRQQAEAETTNALKQIVKAEPKYGDGSQWGGDYNQFKAAHDRWAQNPNDYLYASAQGQQPNAQITPDQVKAYKQQYDTVDDALSAAYADWYGSRINNINEAERDANQNWGKVARAQAEEQQAKPTERDLLTRVRLQYGDKFSEDDLRARMAERGILSGAEKSRLKMTPDEIKRQDIYDALAAVPSGSSAKFANDFDLALNKLGYKGEGFMDQWYQMQGKGFKPALLDAMQTAAASVLKQNQWKTKDLNTLTQEARTQDTFDQMKAEVDKATKGLSGKAKVLAQRLIEDKYGRPLYSERWQPEGEKLVSTGYDELAKVPPGKSDDFWKIVSTEANKVLEAQAKAQGKTYFGISAQSLQDIWYNADPTTLDAKLAPIIGAMQAAAQQLKFQTPTTDTLREWVQAEKEIAEYMAFPKDKKGEKRDYWNAHPLLAKYYSSDTASAPTTSAPARTGGGGGGGGGGAYAPRNYGSPAPTTPPKSEAEKLASWNASLGDVSDGGLRELIRSYFAEPAGSRVLLAGRYQALAFWLAKQSASRLAQLDALYRSLYLTAAAKSYAPKSSGNGIVFRQVRRY